MKILNKYLDMIDVIVGLDLKGQAVSDDFLDEMDILWDKMSNEEKKFCNSFVNIIVGIVRYNNRT